MIFMSRENYYIMLDLDPSVQDLAQITAIISTKQQEWARMRNHPIKSTLAKQNLSQIPHIRRTLADAEQRKKEAAEATRLKHVRLKEQYIELDKALGILTLNGYITEGQIEKLLKQKDFNLFSRVDIEKRIKVPIKKETSEKSTSKEVTPLDASIVKKIMADLTLLNKSTLYDFLKIKPNSTIRALQARVASKDKELRGKSTKDALLTASQELIGQCGKIFKDEENKKRYDKAVDQQRFLALNKLIEYAGLEDKEISAIEFEHLVIKGSDMGIAKEEVIAYVKQYAIRKKWSVQLPGQGSMLEQTLACGVCNALNKPKAKNCSKCGFSLIVSCPDCKTNNSSATIHCSKCGYSIADMPNAISLIRDAKNYLAEGDYRLAKKLFHQAETYWKNHPDVLVGLQTIKTNVQNIEIIRKKIQKLIDQKKFYQARESIINLKKWPSKLTNAKTLEALITKKIEAVDFFLKKASSTNIIFKKEEAYSEALQLSSDCQEAMDGIDSLPSSPPEKMTVKIRNSVILLKWSGVQSRIPVKYRVIRKSQSIPTHSKDGELLIETSQLLYLDETTLPGVTYYYAIFSLRNDKISSKATCSRSVIRIEEVKQLVVLPSDRSISLNWEVSTHAQAIEAWVKKDSLPTKRGDGTQLSTVRKDGLTYDNLINGERYGFLIITMYKNVFGEKLYSSGATIFAAAATPPRAIEKLNVKNIGKLLELSWEVGNDKVELYRSDSPFSYSIGQLVAYSHLSTIGSPIPVIQQGKVIIQEEKHGEVYFLPITVKGEVAIIGNQVCNVSLREVENLQGNADKGEIYLTWSFPQGSQKIEVYCVDPQFPQSGQKYLVTQKEYDSNGRSFKLDTSGFSASEILIRVRTLLRTPNSITKYSVGREILVKLRKTKIFFTVKKRGIGPFFFRRINLEVKIEIEGKLEAPLQLVVKENNRLISFKDQDRKVLIQLSTNDFDTSNKLVFACTYQLSKKSTKNIFFSLIPMDRFAINNLEIVGNGVLVKI